MASGPTDDVADAAPPPSLPLHTAAGNTPDAGSTPADGETAAASGSSNGGGGVKREASVATTDGDDALNKKKKKMGPGSRGVANLTPEQLAKKRANDREAQRAIRERTKNQIENLERRIRDLTSQQPYQELQAVLKAKESVEQENAEIKRRLASIIGMLQSLTGQVPDNPYVSPSQAYVSHIQPPGPSLSIPNTSTPTSTASPASYENYPQSAAQNGGEQARLQLNQQRHDLRHGLEMGPERLGLDFLLDANQRVNKIRSGSGGAQDTPRFQHVPMKHDWTAISTNDHSLRGRPSNWTSPTRPEATSLESPGAHDRTASFSVPIKNSPPTCPLDSLLLDFLSERRQRAAEGLPVHEVVGPRYPSVSSLLNPANSAYSHPLSKVFTDILATFPDVSTLPERVAVLYVMFLLMRWQISPTQENYDRLPGWMVPIASQLVTPHPAWIDHLPFPRMREKLIRLHNSSEYLFDNFFIPFTTTLRLSWPYEETDTLLQNPDTEELMINPVFERHLRNLDNWKLGDAFAKAFPALADTCNLDLSISPHGRKKPRR
ncbi:hypothetical protein HJFPF1_00456 [Paramyrothecium foliicola]|nr:hypothetical protein HJFPF1_00456 [Paramyrothecium foliicola]